MRSPILGHRSTAAWFLIVLALATLVCSRSPVPLPGNGPTEAPSPSPSPADAPTAAPTSTASAGNVAGPQPTPGSTSNRPNHAFRSVTAIHCRILSWAMA